MVKLIKNNSGAIAKFGNGTVQVRGTVVKDTFGRVELVTCKKTKIGTTPKIFIEKAPAIFLDFSSIESLDVVIDKLSELRDEMASNGK